MKKLLGLIIVIACIMCGLVAFGEGANLPEGIKEILSGTNKTKQALMYSSKNKLNEGLKNFNLVATFQFILTIICLAAILITYIYLTL